ncbi:hypothetical protein HYDPIDRAFT_110567 [Hydnomerulius pinastri MD-312]|nr:hypothetical protein HYDPIDRAFT_110567 [Hydnomerulius pinastri MD-312]
MSIQITPLPPNSPPIPQSTPSLMPFHIAYSGPAPVSRYFRVRAAPTRGLARGSDTSASTSTIAAHEGGGTTATPSGSLRSELGSVGGVSEATSTTAVENFVGADVPGTEHVSSKHAIPAQLGVDVGSDPSSAPLDAGTGRGTDMDVDFRGAGSEAQDAGSSLSSPPSRLTASFRGRQMYGQSVQLPEGYGGLVLRAPLLNGNAKGKKKEVSKPLSKNPKSKRKTRSKKINEEEGGEEDEERATDVERLKDEEAPPPPSEKEPKTLLPTSTFSSFTLWTPDIPLDEGRDEYVRALVEWTRLAAEIHSCGE